VDRVGIGNDDFSAQTNFFPEFAIVKLATIDLSGCVVDILNINEYANPVHWSFANCVAADISFNSASVGLAPCFP
jgi:hypothetical protein